MDAERIAEPPKSTISRFPWREFLQDVCFFGAMMVTCFSLLELHELGRDKDVRWLISLGVIAGLVYAVLTFFSRRSRSS